MFEKEEKNSKRLSVDRIADLLRFQVPLNEKTKELIEKIIEDNWNQAILMEKIRKEVKE
jgi:hypothetical protein